MEKIVIDMELQAQEPTLAVMLWIREEEGLNAVHMLLPYSTIALLRTWTGFGYDVDGVLGNRI